MRYFTHVVLGDRRMRDDIGLEYPDFAFARAESIRAAREIAAETLRQGGVIAQDDFVEITDADGRALEVISLAAVVTDATIADRYRQAFHAAPHPYLLLKPNFEILDANAACLRALMTDLTGIRGRKLFDVLSDYPNDPDGSGASEAASQLALLLKDKQPRAGAEHRCDIRRPDGTREERHWKFVSIPVLDDNGEVDSVLIHLEDVTQQVLAGSRGE